MKLRARAKSGFNLMELVLALGVIAVAIVPLLGLLSVSFATNKDSGDDTVIAAMATQVISQLRAEPFDTLESELKSSPRDYNFDASGTLLLESASAQAVYCCSVTKNPASTAAGNLLEVTLSFASLPKPANARGKNFHASLARY